jgi:hypothetical protein
MGEEGPPVFGCLLGVGSARDRILTVGNLHLIRDRCRHPTQPLNRPGAPGQGDAVGGKDLFIERPPDRRAKYGGISSQIAVRVGGQRSKERREVILRHIRVDDRDRPFRANPLSQGTDGHSHRLERVAPLRGAIVGDDDRPRRRRERHSPGGPLKKRDRRRQPCGLHSRAAIVKPVSFHWGGPAECWWVCHQVFGLV